MSSPGDPLFYLHHAFLDWIWWRWQEIDLKKRKFDIAGYTTSFKPPTGWVNATLDDVLHTFGIVPNVTIRQTLDTRNAPLCFVYE